MQMLVVAAMLPSLMLMSRTRVYSVLRMGGAVFGGLASAGWMAERLFDVATPVDLIRERVRAAFPPDRSQSAGGKSCLQTLAYFACSANGLSPTGRGDGSTRPIKPGDMDPALAAASGECAVCYWTRLGRRPQPSVRAVSDSLDVSNQLILGCGELLGLAGCESHSRQRRHSRGIEKIGTGAHFGISLVEIGAAAEAGGHSPEVREQLAETAV